MSAPNFKSWPTESLPHFVEWSPVELRFQVTMVGDAMRRNRSDWWARRRLHFRPFAMFANAAEALEFAKAGGGRKDRIASEIKVSNECRGHFLLVWCPGIARLRVDECGRSLAANFEMWRACSDEAAFPLQLFDTRRGAEAGQDVLEQMQLEAMLAEVMPKTG